MMDADHELAKRLQVEEQGKLTIKERSKLFVELMNERKKHFASINITTAEPVTTISAPITTAGVSISTAEPSTPPTITTTVIKDKDLIIAQTLMKIRSEKSKEKAKERGSKEKSSKTATRPTRGVIMREASETTTTPTVPPQQKINPKDKVRVRWLNQRSH
nr:hypothetical protein [Tanacetum cinerariifolium]